MTTPNGPAPMSRTIEESRAQRRVPPAPTIPTITDAALRMIQETGPRDSLGRAPLYLFWLADNIGPRCDETGTRGQVFHTDPDRLADRLRTDGYRVEFLPRLERGGRA